MASVVCQFFTKCEALLMAGKPTVKRSLSVRLSVLSLTSSELRWLEFFPVGRAGCCESSLSGSMGAIWSSPCAFVSHESNPRFRPNV